MLLYLQSCFFACFLCSIMQHCLSTTVVLLIQIQYTDRVVRQSTSSCFSIWKQPILNIIVYKKIHITSKIIKSIDHSEYVIEHNLYTSFNLFYNIITTYAHWHNCIVIINHNCNCSFFTYIFILYQVIPNIPSCLTCLVNVISHITELLLYLSIYICPYSFLIMLKVQETIKCQPQNRAITDENTFAPNLPGTLQTLAWGSF